MSALQVNSVTRARQCWAEFGGRTCVQREDRRDKQPLKQPISHRCGVWLYSSEGWAHIHHECRRCGVKERVR